MIITIDNIAHRYSQLPSQVLANADTFDLHVLDISNRHQIRQHNIARGIKDPIKQPSKEELLDMIKRVKERKRGN